jgi:hypothetical protein
MHAIYMHALCMLLLACGGTPTTIDTPDTSPADDDAGAVFCDLGAQGGHVTCDPASAWWYVDTTNANESTFAACSRSTCPMGTACFVGSAIGYCR